MPTLSTIGAACARAWGFTSGLVKDQYFNLTSLLLPGNGTNGAQNNTFLDGSSNTFTITRNGNTTQGTFSPFSQTGWGNYFDGSGDYLTFAPGASFAFGTSDFTVETWFYAPSAPGGTASYYLLDARNSGQTTNWAFGTNLTGSSSTMRVDWYTGATVLQGSNAIVGAWNHCVYVRTGTTYGLFVNGTRAATGTDSTNYNVSPTTSYIGSGHAGGPLNGYLSSVRVVKGTAVYDPTQSTLTVPTSPLTAVTNTSLLTCQSNRFIDNSSSPKTITANGNTSVVAFSPFAPTQSYSASAVGGSGYFDGTGDYLSLTDEAAYDFGAGDFSIDFWYYPISAQQFASVYNRDGQDYPLCIYSGTSISPAWPECVFAAGTASSWFVTSLNTSGVRQNSWNHIAFTRVGSTWRAFTNGVLSTVVTASGTIASGGTPWIGKNGTGAGLSDLSMYLSGFRMVKGGVPTLFSTSSTTTGTSIFTPPSLPVTNSESLTAGSLSLLLNFTNAGVVDATAKNVLETVGNAQISTSVSKFGGGSISFDGTSNTGLKAPTGNLFTFGSGAFTIEFWVRFNSVAADQMVLNLTGTTIVLAFYVSATGTLSYYLSSDGSTWNIVSGALVGSISTGQWYRVALVRSGNTFTPYLNTTAGTPTTSSAALATPGSGTFLHLGMSNVSASNLSGYLDDVRVTRGVARDMTVLPTAPFPVQ